MRNFVFMLRAPRNRTLVLDERDNAILGAKLIHLHRHAKAEEVLSKTIHQDITEVTPFLPERFADLLFIDPPYNLTKSFGADTFYRLARTAYHDWFASWFVPLLKILKPDASVYVCAEWRFSSIVEEILSQHLIVRNRITWEREKGRGAKANWKNSSEDIWFATVSHDYYFNVEAAKLRRRVIAPYRDAKRNPKDWSESIHGNYRLTHPSNLWTDLTVPFWSMPENTDHPTQKPEKLLAKIILASSRPSDVIFDPFLGSGTTSVVAKKLGRNYCGVEKDTSYCLLAEKRLQLAETDKRIQGYEDGVFYERNAL